MRKFLLILTIATALAVAFGGYTWGGVASAASHPSANLHSDGDGAMSDPGGGGNYLPTCYYTGQMHWAWGQWWRCIKYSTMPGGTWFPVGA